MVHMVSAPTLNNQNGRFILSTITTLDMTSPVVAKKGNRVDWLAYFKKQNPVDCKPMNSLVLY